MTIEAFDQDEEREFSVTHQSIDELVYLAQAARRNGVRMTFRGLRTRRISDLLRIVAAGARWTELRWAS